MTELRFEDLDVDGAFGEAVAELHGTSRAQLLRGAVVGSGALLGLLSLPSIAAAQTPSTDQAIMNYALLLEELQSAFYTDVDRNKVLTGALKEQATTVATHERAHVTALRKALGSKAIKRPHFDFGSAVEGPTAFRRTAVAFEDLAVEAYKGQAPKVKSRAVLASLLAIHSVEARHAAWIRRLAGKLPAASAFDDPRSAKSTLKLVADTKFVMTTKSTGSSPRFTG
jgi:Ferritin-like domain